jgi:AcrR family transcriptional regulator
MDMTEMERTGTAERRRRTRSRLTSEARILTAERGLNGYTVEELCERVGVSRRTFFNYFPSKEGAVVGMAPEIDRELLAEFHAIADRPRAESTSTLIDDLGALAVAHVVRAGITREEIAQLTAAVAREPKLIGAMVLSGEEQHRALVAVIAERDGVALDDPEANLAVGMLALLLRRSAEEFFAEHNTRPFADVFLSNLSAARAVLAPAGAADRSKELVSPS